MPFERSDAIRGRRKGWAFRSVCLTRKGSILDIPRMRKSGALRFYALALWQCLSISPSGDAVCVNGGWRYFVQRGRFHPCTFGRAVLPCAAVFRGLLIPEEPKRGATCYWYAIQRRFGAVQPPSGTFVVVDGVSYRRASFGMAGCHFADAYGECCPLHAEHPCLCGWVSLYRGLLIPEEPFPEVVHCWTSWLCLSVCSTILMSLFVRGIFLRRSVCYWYAALRGGHWSS